MHAYYVVKRPDDNSPAQHFTRLLTTKALYVAKKQSDITQQYLSVCTLNGTWPKPQSTR